MYVYVPVPKDPDPVGSLIGLLVVFLALVGLVTALYKEALGKYWWQK